MPRSPIRSLLALVLALLVAFPSAAAFADARRANEPWTTTIRIRLKGPTLRVRCRGGDCVVTVVGQGDGIAVSVTRTRDGVPFTFAKSLPLPKNVAIETGIGTDDVTLSDVAVPGFLRIATGTGDDALHVSNVTTAKKASIDTGDGADTVSLTATSFGGKFRFFGQAGDDDVTLSGGTYADKVGLNGGKGVDALVTQGDQFAEPPVVQSFER